MRECLRGITAKFILALVLITGGSGGAAAWGWWDTCDGGYTCYGPPYGNTEPPDHYVYDHRRGPTWTGNGWAYLPIGRYRPRPPEYVEPPPPPPPSLSRRGRLRWRAAARWFRAGIGR